MPIEEAFNKEISSLWLHAREQSFQSIKNIQSAQDPNLKEESIMCVERNISGNISKLASLHMNIKEKNSFKKKEFQIKQIFKKFKNQRIYSRIKTFYSYAGEGHNIKIKL